ncbi:MAG: sigma 54-interacting transcriptional regulator, partial [Bacteroidales bacterium]|nr:sigma 54-interacting transcriptional regulator [Bacteroidales bacterium]
KIIHDNSARKNTGNIISVNCGAIPEGTIESELFGHVKGAYTNADRDRKGYFEEADKGTIFLDEIGELPLQLQAKLLRVLESGEMMRVGSSKVQKVNVRVVAATNLDMAKAIREGRFREDLYYRLNQISIHLPSLRERKEDIELLFRWFASNIAEKYHMPMLQLTDDAKDYIINYPWYGNVRELKNITEQMSVIESTRTITREVAMKYLRYELSTKLPTIYQPHEIASATAITDRELLLKALSMGQMITEMRAEINELKNTLAALVKGGISLGNAPQQLQHSTQAEDIYEMEEPITYSATTEEEEKNSFLDTEVIEEESLSLEDRKRDAIQRALEKYKGNRRLAAAELDISERTLYRKLKEYEIEL